MNSTDVRVQVSRSVSLYNAAVHFKTWTSTQDLKSKHTLFCLFLFGLDIFLNLYFKNKSGKAHDHARTSAGCTTEIKCPKIECTDLAVTHLEASSCFIRQLPGRSPQSARFIFPI